jgi:uncharacterized membrane protein YphA (DoxX/SURF4 family)
MSLRDLVTVWQNFWFKPESPLAACLFRIIFGMVFFTQIVTQYWIDFKVFFGSHPMIPYQDFIAYWWKLDVYVNIFEMLPAEDFWHAALMVFTAFLSIMLIVGFLTRFSAILLCIIYSSLAHQYPFLCNSGDNMQRLALLLLCFMRSGDGLSVDSYLKNRNGDWRKAVFDPAPASPWAQRMLQVQVAIAYTTTALLKFNSPVWFFGNGCYFATRLTDFAKMRLPFILDNRICLELMCWGTIIIEGSLGVAIWIKEIRYWVIFAGILLHLGIDWTLNIPIFEFAFMSIFILFIDPNDLKKLGHWLKLFGRRLCLKKTINRIEQSI